MIIRKLFRFEGSHIVRNCSSDRCKRSIHGHSYVVEVLLKADTLDAGHMVYDFGLFKGTIKDLIDSFDHSYSMWTAESKSFKDFIREESARYIEMPISPSAEGYALMFAYAIDKILKNTEFSNEEGNVQVSSVRVSETVTGYAEATMEDVANMWNFHLQHIEFSPQVKAEWKDPDMWGKVIRKQKFINPKIKKTHG